MILKDFVEEATIMKEMKHPNLVQLLGKLMGKQGTHSLRETGNKKHVYSAVNDNIISLISFS